MSEVQTALLCSLALALVATVGCDNGVKVGNLPGHIAFVGPSEASGDAVTTFFGVSDPEGDVLEASFEVCAGAQGCSSDVQVLPGSATLDALPAIDPERASSLQVVWCDPRLGPNDPFVVKMKIVGSDIDEVLAPPATLRELGFDAAMQCP